jgi:hypothetical protein
MWRRPEITAMPRAIPDGPHRKLRMHAWLAWKLKLDGIGHWVYNLKWFGRYSGFPTIAPRGPYSNCSFIYMGHDGPVTSRRLEAYREGMEDYKLLWTIQQAAAVAGQDAALVAKARKDVKNAADEVLAAPAKTDVFLRWQRTLLADAAKLCSALPLDVKVTGVVTTGTSATVRVSASRSARLWAWVHDNSSPSWRFITVPGQSTAPVLTVNGLVRGQTSQIVLVAATREGRQKVLTRTFKTQSWPVGPGPKTFQFRTPQN